MKSPILGSSYVLNSINAANTRMVNLFPEIIPEGGNEAAYLQRCPGLSTFATVGSGPIRGQWVLNSLLYVVSGNQLYSVTTAGSSTLLGTVSSGSNPVSIADNGSQIFIACNPDGFIYNVNTGVFQQITDPDFPGAKTVGYLDGYFVFSEPNSGRIWVTAIFEGTQIDALDFASAEGDPDGIESIVVDHREVWIFGSNSTEVWYNAGLADFPLQRIQGTFTETGCIAPYSVAKLDNGVFWLGGDKRGSGIVYRSNGYAGQRVSTHAVEVALRKYGDISDAIGWTYQEDGHSFYVLTFPGQIYSWVYDVATDAWHERAGFDETTGQFARHRPVNHSRFNFQHLVGDYQNGKLYKLDSAVYDDDGTIQKWLRSWNALPTNANSYKRKAHYELQLICQSGVGLVSGQGSDPQVTLRWSDDGGHTWSNYHTRSMGAIGEHGHRVIWRRLGMTDKLRTRVFEVTGTDPVKIAIMGAELDLEETAA